MIGMSSSGKEEIKRLVEDMFDRIALEFIGDIPGLSHRKSLIISGKTNFGLAHLFVKAMADRRPNQTEQDALKSLLDSAHGYIESLKNKTQSNLAESIDGLVKEAKAKNQKIDQDLIQEAIAEEMRKAKSHLKLIAESEATKIRNVGKMMNITRVAANVGDDDPSVFFIIVRDKSTCKECLRLHMMPDGVTPKVWKFSELKQGYHLRTDNVPSAFGEHPHCRCTLAYLTKGFGFNKKGMVSYKTQDHDEYKRQNPNS